MYAQNYMVYIFLARTPPSCVLEIQTAPLPQNRWGFFASHTAGIFNTFRRCSPWRSWRLPSEHHRPKLNLPPTSKHSRASAACHLRVYQKLSIVRRYQVPLTAFVISVAAHRCCHRFHRGFLFRSRLYFPACWQAVASMFSWFGLDAYFPASGQDKPWSQAPSFLLPQYVRFFLSRT